MWLTEFIAALLWNAHIAADPNYTAIPGLTKEESMQAGTTLFMCSGYTSPFEITYETSDPH